MKKTLALLSLAACASFSAMAQDIHFSQFYENAMLRNPALTGIFTGDYKAVVNYRTQWGTVAAPFQTFMASAEGRSTINKESGDALSYGVSFSYDKAGSINFTSLQVYPSIAFNKSLEDEHSTFLSVGFTGGYIQRSVDASKMTFDNQYVNGQYDQANTTGESFTYKDMHQWDLGAGISLNSTAGADNRVTYYAGVAAYHVARPRAGFNKDDYFTRLNTKWSGNLGVQWRINPNFALTLHGNYTNQWPHQETIVGGLISYRNFDQYAQKSNFALYAGAFYRFKDAIIPTVRLDYNYLSFILSYDVNNSSLAQSVSGTNGFEISLVARGKRKHIANPTDQVVCPHFELNQPGYQDY